MSQIICVLRSHIFSRPNYVYTAKLVRPWSETGVRTARSKYREVENGSIGFTMIQFGNLCKQAKTIRSFEGFCQTNYTPPGRVSAVPTITFCWPARSPEKITARLSLLFKVRQPN